MHWSPVDLAFSLSSYNCSSLTRAYSRSLLSILCAIVVQCWGVPALQSCRYQTAEKMLTKKTLESKRETAGAILAEQSSSGDVRQSFWVAAKSHNMVTKIVQRSKLSMQYKKKGALEDLVEHKKSSFHCLPIYLLLKNLYLCFYITELL